jgi:hypothetical protein
MQYILLPIRRFELFVFTHQLTYGIIASQLNSPNTALLSREAEGTALRCLDNQSTQVEYGAKSDRKISGR